MCELSILETSIQRQNPQYRERAKSQAILLHFLFGIILVYFSYQQTSKISSTLVKKMLITQM